MGLHHADRGRLGRTTASRTCWSTRSGGRSTGIETSALARPRSSRLLGRSRSSGTAAAPARLGMADACGDGKGLLTQWRTTPVAVDWNRDGLTDLVMLDHEGYLAFFERTPTRRRARADPGRAGLRRSTANRSGSTRGPPARAAGASSASWTGTATASSTCSSTAANAEVATDSDAQDNAWRFEDDVAT